MPKTLNLSTAIGSILTQSHDASDIKTCAAGIAAIAKAAKAFNGVTLDSKRATFAHIAGIARVTESDACNLAGMAGKDSNLRNALRGLRRSITLRIMSATVAHDAAADATEVVAIDRMVSNLDIIAKHLSSIIRSESVTSAVA
jgi:hypothetical protein